MGKNIIRYGELSTKGKNRKEFISHLRNNIKISFLDLPNIEGNYAERDRMFVTSTNDTEIQATNHKVYLKFRNSIF